MRVCRNAKFRHTLLSCVRVSKMQGAEIEDDGSVLKYMTKSEIEEQRSSLLIMTQRLFAFTYHIRSFLFGEISLLVPGKISLYFRPIK